MGLFKSKREGGLMDVIRCDQKDYLMWKWSPNGEQSHKENAIRYGSSLRVKDGEVAVFVYKQNDGTMQDFIVGPFDQTIKTANFPVLTSIVGSAFGGSSPFQAEVYFVNLATDLKMTFWFEGIKVVDPRAPKISVPANFKGSIVFGIEDYKNFIKMHRMRHFTLAELKDKVEDAMKTYITDTVANAPKALGLESAEVIDTATKKVKELIEGDITEELLKIFGVNLQSFYIDFIELDKQSKEYEILEQFNVQYMATISEQTRNMQAEQQAYRQNVADQQAVNIEHQAEAFRIQREEAQRAQRLQTESSHLAAHQLDIQGAVGVTAAESLGQLGSNAGSGMGGDGGGMNPAAMMTGMMMGGAVGGGMSNMMGNMMQGMNTPQPPAPPVGATAQYHISVNGQQAGPYTMAQLGQMAGAGQLTRQTYVWRTGMANWEMVQNMPELSGLFAAVPPPPPAGPATPPPPPTGENM